MAGDDGHLLLVRPDTFIARRRPMTGTGTGEEVGVSGQSGQDCYLGDQTTKD